MGGPIARRPAGLLDLLLAQQQGKNPSSLGDDVLPVIEITDFYNQERIITQGGSLSMTAVNGTNTITIPAGEVWRPIYHACSGTFATTNQTVRIGWEIGSLPGSWQVTHKTERFEAVGATDKFGNAAAFPGCIFPSGTKFLLRVQEINLDAQANIGLNVQMAYIRMES